MDINNFLDQQTIVTFLMTIVVVELWVGFTKEFRFIKKIPTRLYTFMLAAFHLLIINPSANLFEFSVLGYYVLLTNALVIAVILSGGYDIFTKKITLNKEDVIDKKTYDKNIKIKDK